MLSRFKVFFSHAFVTIATLPENFFTRTQSLFTVEIGSYIEEIIREKLNQQIY